MLEQTTIDRSIEIKRSVAIRALRRSNIRRKVTEYLCEISPNCSYTSEIAYHINATSSNVIGALRESKHDTVKKNHLLVLIW